MAVYIVSYIAVVVSIYALLNIIIAIIPLERLSFLKPLLLKLKLKKKQPALKKPWAILSARFAEMSAEEKKSRKNFISFLRLFLKPLTMINERYLTHGKVIEAYQYKFALAGLNITTEEFFAFKEFCAGASLLIYLTVIAGLFKANIILALASVAVGFTLPDIWLSKRIKKQHHRIIKLLPEVIDVLTLCIGAGLDLAGALGRVIVEFKQDEPLIRALSLAAHEMKMGKRRAEALRLMAQRTGVKEVTSFVRAVIQSDKMGTPIVKVLKNYSEDIRMERFQRAERQALKAPIKMLGPLIFCIMPCVAILVGAPIFIQFMRQNPFGDKGQQQMQPQVPQMRTPRVPEMRTPKMQEPKMPRIREPKI